MRIIFHIDMNAFYANCEISTHPELKGKPIVISHESRRSVVSTASYEARKFGVSSAMPLFMAKEKCPHLIVVEPHFSLYHELSQKFFHIVYTYSKKVEIASIDECYVDMSDYFMKTKQQPYIVAKEIQNRILSELSLPCSIGISPNKFLSKMASDMKKPLGITIITQRNIREVLWPLKVGDMFGIGKKTAPKLEEAGIKTIGDVANYKNYQTLRQFLGKNTLIYYNHANGKDLSPVIYEETDMKSIGNSTTFEFDINDEDSVKEEFKKVCSTVSERAKKYNMYSNCIVITLRYSRFNTVTRQMLVNEYINDYEKIYSYVMMLFSKHYNHQPIRLIGVTLNNVKRKESIIEQINIFDHDSKEVDLVDSLIDRINKTTSAHLIKAKDYHPDKYHNGNKDEKLV